MKRLISLFVFVAAIVAIVSSLPNNKASGDANVIYLPFVSSENQTRVFIGMNPIDDTEFSIGGGHDGLPVLMYVSRNGREQWEEIKNANEITIDNIAYTFRNTIDNLNERDIENMSADSTISAIVYVCGIMGLPNSACQARIYDK